MRKIVLLLFTTFLTAGLLTACSGNSGSDDKSVTVGAKNYTAQYILSKITTLYLEDNGYDVEEVNGMGSTALRKALENDQVDFTWEYTGTALVTYLDQDPIVEPEKSFEEVKKIDEDNDLIWMNMSDINNTYALALKEEKAEELGLETISDLAEYVNNNPDEISMAMDPEFAERADGIKGAEELYDFELGSDNIKEMKTGLQYGAIDKGGVNSVMVFTTDAQIKEFDLRVLEDDKGFFPAYHAAVSMREDVYEDDPELEDLTADIAEKLSSETMINLTYQVDIEDKKVDDVAEKWLEEQGLLD